MLNLVLFNLVFEKKKKKVRIRVNVVMQRKETPKPKDAEVAEVESKKERTIEEIFESVKVGKSLTLKEALGYSNTGDRKNLSRLYAGLSSSRDGGALGMATPGGSGGVRSSGGRGGRKT